MAGIAAYFGNDHSVLADLAGGLASRGPDTVSWRDGRLGLTVRAALPMVHTHGGLAAAMEGVTETSGLLDDYAAHGPSALVRGGETYAIAVADPDREALLLARSGDGPALYYAVVGNTVLAAAEPNALLAAGIPAEPNPETVTRFVDTGACDDTEQTFFTGIRRVLPGQVIEVTRRGLKRHHVPMGEAQPSLSLPLAVQEAVRHGRRIGVRLGDTEDDSVVLAAVLAHPSARRPVPAYHPVFGADEPPEATAQPNVRREPVPISAAGVLSDLPAYLADLGEPVPELGCYLLWASARLSMGDVDTLLDPDTGRPGGHLCRVGDRISARFGVAVRFPLITSELPEQAGDGEAERLAELLYQIKDRVYGSFLTGEFASRPWVDSSLALARLDGFVGARAAGGGSGGRRDGAGGQRRGERGGRRERDVAWLWRLFLVEQWLRGVASGAAGETRAAQRPAFSPHPGKHLEAVAGGRSWLRFPVRTDLVGPGERVPRKVAGYVSELVAEARANPMYRDVFSKPWYLVTAEKVVAVAQRRSYLLWEIQPGRWARMLARLASRRPYGTGHRSAWIMELAIREVGRWRMLLATLAALVGPASWFDRVAGHRVAAIDGPAEHSGYPANLTATLGAAEPEQVAGEVLDAVRRALPDDAASQLRGCAVVDARDGACRVRGVHADRTVEFFEEVCADNPLGQGGEPLGEGGERTPVAVVVSASTVRRPRRSKPRPKRSRATAKAR